MKITTAFALLALTLACLCTNSTLADQCITQGDRINSVHSLQSPSIDPYSHLMPDIGSVNSLATTYKIDFKPLNNNLSNLQFETRDTSGPGAGYTSPYLWEAGQGPGYRSPYGIGGNRAYQPGQRYSPIPMPYRR